MKFSFIIPLLFTFCQQTGKRYNITMLVFLLFLVGVVFAQECKPDRPFYQDRERGWFWKEACKPAKKDKEKDKDKEKEQKAYRMLPSDKVSIPWDIIDKLDPQEIAKLEEESRKIAMMRPTPENVSEYRKLLKFIENKARAFALAGYVEYKSTPLAYQPPQYFQVRLIKHEEREKRWKEIFQKYKDRAGLVVLVQKDCPYCKAFKDVLKLFQKETAWQYREVEVSQNPSLAMNLGTSTVPDVFLVLSKDGQNMWQRIGSGFMPLAELKASVIFGLYNLGEIKDENLLDW